MKYEITRKLDYRTVIIIFAGLLISFPCLLYGFPFYGDDSIWTVLFHQQFSRLFWSGDIYPRWLDGLNAGLGNPTAYYYPPLAYWLTSVLGVIFRDDPLGWRQLGVSAALAIVSSGVAVHLWLKQIVNSRGAVIGALFYLIVPYHVSIDVYGRGALAETWTFVWMPLVLTSVENVIARRRYAVPALAVSYAALVLTHLPTTLIFSLVPLTYSFYLAPTQQATRSFFWTVCGMILGTGLSAIYLLPALAMQDFVFHTTQGIGGHYYFANWFLFSQLKWTGRDSEYFNAAVGAMLIAMVVFVVAIKGTVNSPKRRIMFWFAVAVCAFVLMTPLSKGIWGLLATLQKVQFPFRFNTVLSLAVAALTASAAAQFKRDKIFALLTVAAVVVLGSWTYAAYARSYYAYPNHYVDQAVIDSANRRLRDRRDTNEFRPRWIVSIEENELETLLQHIGEQNGELTRITMSEGTANVEKWTAREIDLRVDSPGETTLRVSRFYFPGWYYQIDSGPVQATQPSKPGGLISFKVPAGQHHAQLQLRPRKPERVGQIVSVLSVIVLVSVCVWIARRRLLR